MNRYTKTILIDVLCCFIGMAVLSGTAVMIGRAQPDAAALPELRPCGTAMCVFDIEPRRTAFSAAQTAIKDRAEFSLTHYSRSATMAIAFRQAAPFYRLDLTPIDLETNVINEVNLTFFEGRVPTAGHIIAEFGQPCLVLPQYIPTQAALIYPGMAVFVTVKEPPAPQRINPNLPLARIVVFRNFSSCKEVWRDMKSDVLRKWRGFALYTPLD